MNSLVSADYGSSSSDECSDDFELNDTTKTNVKNFLKSASDSDDENNSNKDDSSSDEQNETNQTKKAILPSASSILLNGSSNTGQVFNNPYKKAENAQIASLEKHVKMVETDTHTQMKNGKKICWNYRKGRCRFGSNCTYAHDSDLHVKDDVGDASETNSTTATTDFGSNDGISKKKISNNKRPGLGDSIIPSKKVIKTYNTLKK